MLVTRRGILSVLTDEAVETALLREINNLIAAQSAGRSTIAHQQAVCDCQSEHFSRMSLQAGRDMGQIYRSYDRE